MSTTIIRDAKILTMNAGELVSTCALNPAPGSGNAEALSGDLAAASGTAASFVRRTIRQGGEPNEGQTQNSVVRH
ncbi:hypothetical protein ACF3MZ_11985 [Paenibacillaceae bacterium WGS1546]|uniref:hypothetical protein n=1 Tax=Cohnella sp. WGS1546 TaxID=3366810 RepID=UPI00372D48F1